MVNSAVNMKLSTVKVGRFYELMNSNYQNNSAALFDLVRFWHSNR